MGPSAKAREKLRDDDREKLASLVKTNGPAVPLYILKELLRKVFRLSGAAGIRQLDKWLVWARRCQVPHVVRVAKSITQHLGGIHAALRLSVSTSRSEALNARIQVIDHPTVIYGFRLAGALIALAFRCLGRVCPQLPGR